MTSPHRSTPTTPIRPVAPGRKARRLRAITAGFAAAATALALMAGVARASVIPTCAHNQGFAPELDTDLASAAPGVYEAQWLYRANGSSWQYTGRYRQAWSHGGTSSTFWTDAAGNVVNTLMFGLSPGSGYYAILERIVTASGPVTFWQKYYLTSYWSYSAGYHSYYTGYCKA